MHRVIAIRVQQKMASKLDTIPDDPDGESFSDGESSTGTVIIHHSGVSPGKTYLNCSSNEGSDTDTVISEWDTISLSGQMNGHLSPTESDGTDSEVLSDLEADKLTSDPHNNNVEEKNDSQFNTDRGEPCSLVLNGTRKSPASPTRDTLRYSPIEEDLQGQKVTSNGVLRAVRVLSEDKDTPITVVNYTPASVEHS